MESEAINAADRTLKLLAGARRAHPQPPPAGSPGERDGLARFAELFAGLREDRIERLADGVYHPDVVFDDTLKTVRGIAALRAYLIDGARATEDCQVAIDEVTRTEAGEHLLRWRMMIRFRRFAKGRDTWSAGMSHLRLAADGRVAYHQDYWNAAEGLFQHVPVLGWGIRAIVRRL
ncbi:MAG: nuclear transport factor 2 family protein [Pseudoxanthomonas sp.]|nr:nuclear transport factor 2 family protein [Pseudoxanthomonas sp.]